MADIVELRKLYAKYQGLVFSGPSGRLVDGSKAARGVEAIQKLIELDAAIKAEDVKALEARIAEKDAVIAEKDAEIGRLTRGGDEEMTLNGGLR